MTDLLTIVYLACFQACAWPSIVRVCRRRSSADLSIWRELLIICGVSCQFAVMMLTGASWRVWLSPLFSGASVIVMLVTIYRFRRDQT
jgi:hypothetical protein